MRGAGTARTRRWVAPGWLPEARRGGSWPRPHRRLRRLTTVTRTRPPSLAQVAQLVAASGQTVDPTKPYAELW